MILQITIRARSWLVKASDTVIRTSSPLEAVRPAPPPTLWVPSTSKTRPATVVEPALSVVDPPEIVVRSRSRVLVQDSPAATARRNEWIAVASALPDASFAVRERTPADPSASPDGVHAPSHEPEKDVDPLELVTVAR